MDLATGYMEGFQFADFSKTVPFNALPSSLALWVS